MRIRPVCSSNYSISAKNIFSSFFFTKLVHNGTCKSRCLDPIVFVECEFPGELLFFILAELWISSKKENPGQYIILLVHHIVCLF